VVFMGCRGPKPKTLNVSCPNENCPDYGKISKGNIVANGTYKARGVRMHKYICRTCSKSFSSSSNTIFHDLRTDEKTILLALKMIVKGMSLRGTAEILEVKLDTVRGWLQKAAEHSEEVDKVLIKELNVDKVELDELWTFVQKKQFRKWSTNQKMKDGSG
jgi:transposase-like protein